MLASRWGLLLIKLFMVLFLPVTGVFSTGVITGVDEKAAVSWEECDGCGSDQLAARSAVG